MLLVLQVHKVFFTEKGLEYCKGISKNSPIINIGDWVDLGQKVIQDLAMNTVLIKNWNESVKKRAITPSVRDFVITIFNLKQ